LHDKALPDFQNSFSRTPGFFTVLGGHQRPLLLQARQNRGYRGVKSLQGELVLGVIDSKAVPGALLQGILAVGRVG
jgi:hypothetical protein